MILGPPGVYSQETDLTAITRLQASTNAAIVGAASKGPVGGAVFISNDKQFVETFGAPDPSIGYAGYAALAVLRQGGGLWFTRTVNNATFPLLVITKDPGQSATGTILKTLGAVANPGSFTSADDAVMFWPIGPGVGYSNIAINIADVQANAGVGDYDFTVQVLDAANNYASLESFRVSTRHKTDGYNKQMFIEDVINIQSKLIRVAYNDETTVTITAGATAGTNNRLPFGTASAGTAVTDAQIVTAWQAMVDTNKYQVSMLVNAGYATAAVQQAMLQVAQTRDDCFAILDLPSASQSAADAKTYRDTTLNANSSYGILVGPDYLYYDELSDRTLYVPASGEVAARAIYTDSTRDPWIAIAGLNRGLFKNCQGLRVNYSQQEQKILTDSQICYVLTQPGDGHALWGQQTLTSKASAVQSLNIRRLLNVLKPSMARAARYSLWEPNDELTRTKLVQQLDEFLMQVKNRRGVYDYLVVCDSTNNTSATIEAKQLNVDIYLKPTYAAEWIKVQSVLAPNSANFQELVATGGNF